MLCIRICHTMGYVQVYIRNNSSVCTSAGDCVSACSCIMRELKIVNTTDVIAEWA